MQRIPHTVPSQHHTAMNIKKHIPNTITCCNLLCGCLATGMAFHDNLSGAFALIIFGAVFDFFDGFAARLLHVSSEIGKELDSLADDITFGLAPAAIVASMTRSLAVGTMSWLGYVPFLIAAFSALRLAKFNLDTRQSMGFIGLPTPANALFWGALAVALTGGEQCSAMVIMQHLPAWASSDMMLGALLVGTAFSCWILVSEVPMFALKFKTYGWKGNEVRYSFLLASLALLALLGWAGFSAIIVLYVIVSVATQQRG